MRARRSDTSLAYRQLWENFWESPEWAELPPGPPSPRLLLLFLAVGPVQRSIPGVLLAGVGEVADRLGWSGEEVRDNLQQLEAAGALRADLAARLIWLPWRYGHEAPANPNVVKSWRVLFERWPRGELAGEVHAFLRQKVSARGKAFADAFESLPVPASLTNGSGNGSGNGSRNDSGNQRINESENHRSIEARASAAAPTAAAGELFEVPASKAAKATKAEVPDHQALKEHWFAGYRARNAAGADPAWDGGDGNTCNRVLKSLGIDGAKAHLDRYFARHDGDDFWRGKGLGFKSAFSTETINLLRSAAPAAAAPAKRGYVALTNTAERFKNYDDGDPLGLGPLRPRRASEPIPASSRAAHIAEALDEERRKRADPAVPTERERNLVLESEKAGVA